MAQVRVGWRAYVGPASGTDADAQSFVSAAGIADSTQVSAINTLVADLKAYGLWTKMKAIYPFVGGSAASHKFNLKDPRNLDTAYRLVFNGGWTHTGTGAQPNGTTGYANTYYNPSSLLNPFIGYYSRSNTNTNTDQIDMGCFGSDNGNKWFWLSAWYKTTTYNNILARNSSSNVLLDGGIQSDSRGWYWTNKISNVAKLGRNSNILTTANDIQTPPNASIGIGAMGNSNTSANYFSNRETVFSVIADGLTDTETSNLYIVIQKFQTTLGRHVGTPYVSDPDAIAFLMAAGITDGTQAAAINTLVIRMKADGVWTKMKAIYPFVGGTAFSHKWNLKDPRDLDAAYRLVFSGGWTHTSLGSLPNGTTAYANTYLVPLTSLSQNSTHISYYSRTNNGSGGADFGAAGTGFNNILSLNLNENGRTYFRINRTYTTTESFTSIADSRLFYMLNRTSSSQEILFTNTTKNTFNYNSTGLSNYSMYLGAMNNSGTPQYYGTKQTAFASIGDGLTDAEATAFYNAVQAFQTTLGRQVNIPVVSDTDAQAFLNAANITSFQQASAVNKLVVDLKAAGVWTKMKAIYPFVGGSAASHKWNLKDPRDLDAAFRLVFFGGGTHGNNGYQLNGNSYANTYFNPSLNLTTSSAHHSVYLRLDLPISPFKAYGCMTNFSQGSMFLYPYSYNIGWISDLFDYSQSRVSSNSGNSTGYVIGTRASSNSNKLFRNGTQIASSSNSTGGIIPNLNYFIGAYNNNGSPNDYDTNQIAFYSLGDGLTDTEATSLYTAVQSYQTSLGRQLSTPVYNNGLVLNLDAGNATSYPGTGTSWFDLASGNNGTLVNGVTYDNTNSGGLTLNGSNQYINISSLNNTNLNFTTSDKFTISCYFKATSTPSTFLGLVVSGNTSGEWNYGIWVTNGKIQVGTHNDGRYGNSTIVAGQIYQVTLTYSNNTMIIYLNGVNDGTFTSVSLFNGLNQQLVIGRKGANAGWYFPGTIYNVQIYNRSLSATEILNNFNSSRGRFGL